MDNGCSSGGRPSGLVYGNLIFRIPVTRRFCRTAARHPTPLKAIKLSRNMNGIMDNHCTFMMLFLSTCLTRIRFPFAAPKFHVRHRVAGFVSAVTTIPSIFSIRIQNVACLFIRPSWHMYGGQRGLRMDYRLESKPCRGMMREAEFGRSSCLKICFSLTFFDEFLRQKYKNGDDMYSSIVHTTARSSSSHRRHVFCA